MRPELRRTVLALVCLAAPAMARDINGSGIGIVVAPPPTSTPLSDGRTYMPAGNRQVLVADDATHPFHRMPMTCDGACLMSGETGTCSGSCTASDAAGDMVFFTWEGQAGGTWQLVGGTGKFAGSSGSGTWKDEGVLGAGFMHNSWQGTITMP